MQAITLIKYGQAHEAFQLRSQVAAEPRAGEIRIRCAYSGLNFADVLARLGLYQEAPPLPAVLGYEVSGTVDALGEGVRNFKVGDRVLAFCRFGGYASHTVVPARSALRLSENTPLAEATALATQYTTAYYAAYEMAHLQPGDRILIQAAAGGVGIAIVQLALLRGAEIWATASAPDKLKLLSAMGVQHVINYREKDFASAIPARSLDLVFDSLGGQTFRKSLKLLRAGGRIVSFGAAEMAGEKKDLWRLIRTLLGFGFYHPVQFLTRSQGLIGVNMLKVADQRPDVLHRCMAQVLSLYEQGKIKPVMGGIYPARDIALAHEKLGSRSSVGKIAVEWPQ